MTEIRENNSERLVETVIEGLQETKGVNIVKVDLREIESSICKYFVICSGTSNTHVSSLADGLEDYVFEKTRDKVWKQEGKQHGQWILLDYADVIVHIFQEEYREFYKIEELWADAKVTVIEEA